VSGTTANPGQLTGSLSEDGKTLTITAASPFNGEYTVKTTDSIKTTGGVAVPGLTSLIKVDDKVAPKLLSATASAKTSTSTFAVKFDEPVDATGAIVYVNGVAGTVTNNASNPNQLDVTSSSPVAAGASATIRLVNVKDYNNNFTEVNPLETTVTVAADTTAPTVQSVKVTGENKVEVTYDKNISVSSFAGKARLVNASGSVTNLTATAGTDAKTVVLTGAGLSYTSTYNGILYIDADVKDTAGNSTAAYSAPVTFNKDVTAPTLTSTEFKSGKVVATFSEDIASGTNNTVTLINQSTGEVTPVTLNYTATTGNAVIDHKTLTINPGTLANGTYQLRLPANTVVDTAGTPNANALAVQNVVVTNTTSTDTVRPTVASITNTPVAAGVAPGAEQTATYTAADADSGVNLATVRDINNYTWDGKALPAGSYVTTAITGTTDKATSVAVTVHVPSTGISSTKTAAFTVNGIKDNAGNYIAAIGTGNVGFADGVTPEFNSAAIAGNKTSLVLGFTEATVASSVDPADFVVTLNGVALPAAAVGALTPSNTEPNKYVTSITAQIADGDTTVVGTSTAPKDVVFFDTDATPGLSSGDLVLSVLDPATYGATETTTTVDLTASYVTSLKVKLVSETADQVKDTQGNVAKFNTEITVK
jgi:hypothetical protein